MKVEGQCHCGAVVYEAEVEPDTIYVCHCLDCQTQSGSPFRAVIPASAATFRVVKGKPREYVKVADSGNRRVHAFCENCGSPVYSSTVENRQMYSLRVGALRQRNLLGRPARQIWTNRRLMWVEPLKDVPEFNGQP